MAFVCLDLYDEEINFALVVEAINTSKQILVMPIYPLILSTLKGVFNTKTSHIGGILIQYQGEPIILLGFVRRSSCKILVVDIENRHQNRFVNYVILGVGAVIIGIKIYRIMKRKKNIQEEWSPWPMNRYSFALSLHE